jgi:PhnB protein
MIFPTLSVRDLEKSVNFYTQQLAFALDFSLPGADGTAAFARVSLGRARFGLTRVRNPDFDSSAVGFMVYLPDDTDLEHYYEEVQARGATIVEPLQDRYWGDRNFVVRDPDGYALAMSKAQQSLSVDDLAAGTRADDSLA